MPVGALHVAAASPHIGWPRQSGTCTCLPAPATGSHAVPSIATLAHAASIPNLDTLVLTNNRISELKVGGGVQGDGLPGLLERRAACGLGKGLWGPLL